MNTFKNETIITTIKGEKRLCRVTKYPLNCKTKLTDYNKHEHSFR